MTCSSSLFFEEWNRTQLVIAAGTGATPAAFNLGLCRLRSVLSPPAPHDHAAGGLFYFATKKIGIGRGAVATTTSAGGTVLLCRHDGAASILEFRPRLANRCSRGAILGRNRAVILDFKPRLANRCSLGADLWQNRASIPDFRPRLANRCSQEAKTRAILASIPDFRPRLANRCSQEAKTRAILASILDFRPRLANRCSQEVKTGAIPPSQGSEALCRGRGMPDGQGLRTA